MDTVQTTNFYSDKRQRQTAQQTATPHRFGRLNDHLGASSAVVRANLQVKTNIYTDKVAGE